eukprot:scpid72437/ scgid0309/ 
MQNTRATRAGRVEISPSIAILLIILSCSLFAAFGMEDSLKRKCCKCFFAAFGILVYGFQVVILYWFLLPSLYIIKYFRMKKDPFDAEDPDTRARVYLYGFLLVVLDLIVVTIWIKLLAYDPWRCNQSRPTCVWLGWMCYSLHLASKLALIYIVVAEYTDAESEVGSNLLKTAVACTSVVYLCLTQVFFHDVGHQVSDTGRQVSDVGRQVSDVDNQVSDGRAQSDQTPPPPRSVDRMTMGVVFDIIDNAELLDLLLKDGRRGGEENQDTIGDHLGIAFAVFGALAFCLPTLALYSLHACVAKQEKAETNVTPSVTTSLLSGDNKRSFTWWKKFYLVSSFFFNVCFLILRIVAAARGNAEVGIFISKNIIFLIAYGLEILETRRPAASEGTGTGDGQDGERVT